MTIAGSSRKVQVVTIFGTRPEAIKMAPVVRRLSQCDHLSSRVLVTAQHREMLDQVLSHFQITPDYDLNLMKAGQTLTELTSRVLVGVSRVLSSHRPDLVLVHGDTTTTFAAALAAFYQQIPVGHVEAGLRTGEKYSPFPEELNRRLTGSLADWHFAPTRRAADNLLAESIREDRIIITGNTAIDALQETVSPHYRFADPHLEEILNRVPKTIVVEVHRRENWGEPMRQIITAVRDLARKYRSEVGILFSVHRNPVVADPVRQLLADEPNIQLFDPLDYPDWANLMARSYLIMTDSGGIQEEAPSLGVPVVLLRTTTERPEAVEAGTVLRVDPVYDRIVQEVGRLIEDPASHRRMARAANPFGDGRASERIVQTILYHFGYRLDKPQPLHV